MGKKYSFLKKYSFFVGLIIFLVILIRSDIGSIIKNIKTVGHIHLILAGLMVFPIYFFKATCWNYLKKIQGIKYSLKNSFLMTASGTFLGLITPGRLGEFSKVLYLKKDGHPLGKSFISTALDRLSDLVFLLGVVIFGSAFFVSASQKPILIIALILIISVVAIIIFIKTGLTKWIFDKLLLFFIPSKYQKSWEIKSQDLVENIKIYKFKNYSIVFLITALSWLSYYLQMYILAKGLDISVPLLYLSISVTVAGLITLIPVSISGIGTRDAALIFLLTPLFIPKEKIIAFSALILLMALFAALIGLICWLIKPIKL